MNNKRIKIAVQKSGNLSEGSFELFKKIGFNLEYNKSRKLFLQSPTLPIDIICVRDDDIPTLVRTNVCDLGIVGTNVLLEKQYNKSEYLALSTVADLGFSKCRLSIAIPREFEYTSVKSLDGLSIATTYPKILEKFLEDKGVTAKVIEMSGAVEIAPKLKIADCICDIISTGATLEANNLREVAVVQRCEALLIQKESLEVEKQEFVDRLLKRIDGVQLAKNSKYVMLNAPKEHLDEVIALLPGSTSPSVIPLVDESMVAIHAVCYEPMFWENMEKLKKAGAKAILVLPIEKMMG